MSTARRPQPRKISKLIALSVSYEHDNLLARGLGLEHLKELIVRLARPLLRQGANLVYSGHWRESEDNFTFDLLRIISAEQEGNEAVDDPESVSAPLGRLYSYSANPASLEITPQMEAQWINCCRIVRIPQSDVGIVTIDHSSGTDASDANALEALAKANGLSAMRHIAMQGTTVPIPGRSSPETVPPIAARVVLGGKLSGYSGWLPGIFEEVLVTLEHRAPLYLLGGFGGATEALANVLLAQAGTRPPEFDSDWHKERNPKLEELLSLFTDCRLPPGVRTTQAALDALYALLTGASADLAPGLNTGLSQQDTRELMTTRDMRRAVHLVRKGLATRLEFLPPPD